MDQANENFKVKIDNLINCTILQVILNSDSRHDKEKTKFSPEEIDKILHDQLWAIGLDDTQLPFPDPIETKNSLSLSPSRNFLEAFLGFEDEVIQLHKYESCLLEEFHALCEDYFSNQYRKTGIHNFCQDYKKQYAIRSFDKRDEIDSWLFEQWIYKGYSLEDIRLFVERLRSYCQYKEQNAQADSIETERKIQENTLPEIERLTQQWAKINVITRFFKRKKVFNAYVSTLSDYYLQQIQIESDKCLASFFHIIQNGLNHLQMTVNTIGDILNGNNELDDLSSLKKNLFPDIVSIIEEEHLSLSDMGMSSMTDILNSIQQSSFPEGNVRIQNLRERLAHTLIDKYLYQLMQEHSPIFNMVTDDSGVVYTPDKRILLKAPKRLDRYYIPDGVVAIFDSAFSDVTSLEYIKIPEGVCTIGKFAFQGCSNLKEIILPKSVIQIGDHAFCGCTRLERATFLYPNISLNDELFKDCPALKKERIKTYANVITGWTFDTENKSGVHKATGIELKYCYDNGDGTIRTELVGYPTHVSNLLAQGYSEKEVDATFREVGREFVIICKSLY